MKHRSKKVFLSSFALLILILFIVSPFVISYFYLPGEVRLIAGEEHLFNFELPLKASIVSDQEVVLKTVDNELIGQQTVNLSAPFYATMPEEGTTEITLSFLGIIPLKTVSVQALPYQEVIPCGKVVGIRVNTEGVLVLGVGNFEVEGKKLTPCEGLIETGDLLLSCNGTVLESKEDLREAVEDSNGEILRFSVLRDKNILEVEIEPAYSPSDNEFKVGLWVRDSTQGIGTLTYVDPETGYFGALGHGITDSQTKKIMPVREGSIVSARITHIKKGIKGEPGEISGIIDYDAGNEWGTVEENTALGIYGTLGSAFTHSFQYTKVPIAFQDEVHEGKASILVDLMEDEPKEYEVCIQKVSRYSNEPAKGMVLKIVDEELLAKTNGIVQGMSGSPILQDGKLIGAVTHVFIQDPTRGYGIFIENMINNEKR